MKFTEQMTVIPNTEKNDEISGAIQTIPTTKSTKIAASETSCAACSGADTKCPEPCKW